VNIYVSPLALQPDGKVVVGGYSGMFRRNADGSWDPSFNPDPLFAETKVNSLVVQSDGKVLVGGYSGTVISDPDGDYYEHSYLLTRLNADGSRDPSFESAADEAGRTSLASVQAVTVQSDGKVVFGGEFTMVKGATRNRIARLNANGTLDGTYNPGSGANSRVASIALQPDGKVLIGGDFTTFNGANCNHIARLNSDGSLDTSFSVGSGANGGVSSIAVQSDGNILIGGDFTLVNGVTRPRVARLYGDGIAPSLTIARSNNSVIVSWHMSNLTFQLQQTTDLSLPNSWSSVAQPAVTNAGQTSVTVPTTIGRKFFRLKSQ
jgi:uncharacterized delta-60 repeat protein